MAAQHDDRRFDPFYGDELRPGDVLGPIAC